MALGGRDRPLQTFLDLILHPQLCLSPPHPLPLASDSPNPCSPALPSAPLFRASDWLILLTGLGEGDGKGRGQRAEPREGDTVRPRPLGGQGQATAWGQQVPATEGMTGVSLWREQERILGTHYPKKVKGGPGPGMQSLGLVFVPETPAAGRECRSSGGQQELPSWWTKASSEGSWASRNPEGPEYF